MAVQIQCSEDVVHCSEIFWFRSIMRLLEQPSIRLTILLLVVADANNVVGRLFTGGLDTLFVHRTVQGQAVLSCKLSSPIIRFVNSCRYH